jgi:hypothetical protein
MSYIVDEQHAAAVGEWSWSAGKHGHLSRSWSKGGKGHELMHHMVWRLAGRELPQHPLTLDHINRDPSDNRLENLRVATQTLQNYNTKPRSRDTHKLPRGVYFMPSNGKASGSARAKPYAAKVCHRGRQIYCGYHATPEEASAAAAQKRSELMAAEAA